MTRGGDTYLDPGTATCRSIATSANEFLIERPSGSLPELSQAFRHGDEGRVRAILHHFSSRLPRRRRRPLTTSIPSHVRRKKGRIACVRYVDWSSLAVVEREKEQGGCFFDVPWIAIRPEPSRTTP
jgi:hypothetical protein